MTKMNSPLGLQIESPFEGGVRGMFLREIINQVMSSEGLFSLIYFLYS